MCKVNLKILCDDFLWAEATGTNVLRIELLKKEEKKGEKTEGE